VGRITVVLYPFGAGAAATNLYFAGLIASWIGAPPLSPTWAIAGGVMLGVPVTWYFARHVRTLMDRADARPDDPRQGSNNTDAY